MSNRDSGFGLILIVAGVLLIGVLAGVGYVLSQKQARNTALYVTANQSKKLPTPTTSVNVNNPTLLAYPDLESEANSPDNRNKLEVRLNGKQDADLEEALILFTEHGSGQVIATLGMGAFGWDTVTPSNWLSDSRYLFAAYEGGDGSNLFIIRTDGKTFSNGKNFFSMDDAEKLLTPDSTLSQGGLSNISWEDAHVLKFSEGFVDGSYIDWSVDVDHMTLTQLGKGHV